MNKLKVQEYLETHSFDNLSEEYGIKVNFDPKFPDLVCLSYDQLKSPKTEQIVRECRGLVLNKNSLEIYCKPFTRFYNYGEVKNIIDDYEYKNAYAYEKIDGSLMNYYFNHDINLWMVSTKGTTTARNALCKHNDEKVPLLQILNEYFDIDHDWVMEDEYYIDYNNYISFLEKLSTIFSENLNKNEFYICEAVSKYNKVISEYKHSKIYLLAIFDKSHNFDFITENELFIKPLKQKVKSYCEVLEFIKKIQNIDNTVLIEGVVLYENEKLSKIKTPSYVAAHLSNDGIPRDKDV